MYHFLKLIRPGPQVAVLFATAMAALIADEQSTSWLVLLHGMLGTALVVAGAMAMNQRMESRFDAKMSRTATRPLPSRLLRAGQVTAFGLTMSLGGAVYLAVSVGPIVTLMAAIGWGLYVLAYTPLKRVTAWQTPVGAVAGAMPILIGAAMVDALHGAMAWVLFGVVFFWQFPHTMAIGWIHRREYVVGETRVAAVVDPTGRLAGLLSVAGASGLLLVSLVPTTFASVGWLFGLVALLLGLAGVAVAVRFLACPSDGAARAMQHVSRVHLPVLLFALLLGVRWR